VAHKIRAIGLISQNILQIFQSRKSFLRIRHPFCVLQFFFAELDGLMKLKLKELENSHSFVFSSLFQYSISTYIGPSIMKDFSHENVETRT